MSNLEQTITSTKKRIGLGRKGAEYLFSKLVSAILFRWLALGLVVLPLINLQGCCVFKSRTEPSLPDKVVGWKDYKEGGGSFHGNFVLRVGETTDNGKVRIKVLELLPPSNCFDAGYESAQVRAKLEFSRVADSTVICEGVFAERGAGNLNYRCPGISANGVNGIGVRSINLKDQWVYFIVS